MSSITKQQSSISCARRKVSSSTTELRLVLLGKTGSGKSSTANSILGRKVFDLKVSSTSVTKRCRRAGGEFRGRQLMLLDTPGLLDTQQTPQEVQKELRRSVSLLFPGPHAFLIVIPIGRFTQEEIDAVRQIKEAMGSHALSLSVVVFTHGDRLKGGTTVKQCLIDRYGDLAELVAGCGGRYCVFNNQSSKNKGQVSELLALVDGMMQANEKSCYTRKLLQKAEEDLAHQLQEESKLLNEKEETFKKEQEEANKGCCKREVQMLQQKCKREMEELKKSQESVKEKLEKVARDREEAFWQEMEENDKKGKERKIQETVTLAEIRRVDEEKREVLQKKLENAAKKLEVEKEKEMRRSVEEKIHKDEAENKKRVRERELQQIQKEQAVRRREEMKRDALQKELNKLIQRLEETSRKEEERKKQMEEMLRFEREENQRERDIQMKNQRAEKRRTVALQQELRLIKMEIEKQKATEESLKRQLEDNLRRGREKCDQEMSALKKQCDEKCSDMIVKKPAEKHSTVTTVAGYVQEMGLLGLNVALESIGAQCWIR